MDDYLKQLADLYAQAGKNRKEETDSMNDFAGQGEHGPRQRNFTRNMLSQNPNLPQEDVRDYVKNVKDDQTDMVMGAGMSGSPILKVGGAAVNQVAARLPRFSHLLEEIPGIKKILQPFKQQHNIDVFSKAGQEADAIAQKLKLTNEIPIAPAKDLDPMAKKEISERVMKAVENRSLNSPDPNATINLESLEKTVPLDELLKQIASRAR